MVEPLTREEILILADMIEAHVDETVNFDAAEFKEGEMSKYLEQIAGIALKYEMTDLYTYIMSKIEN
jgi:hypothetical protein